MPARRSEPSRSPASSETTATIPATAAWPGNLRESQRVERPALQRRQIDLRAVGSHGRLGHDADRSGAARTLRGAIAHPSTVARRPGSGRVGHVLRPVVEARHTG